MGVEPTSYYYMSGHFYSDSGCNSELGSVADECLLGNMLGVCFQSGPFYFKYESIVSGPYDDLCWPPCTT